MNNSQLLLEEVNDKYNNAEWLEKNSKPLLEAITIALRDNDLRSNAVNALLLTFPYVLPIGNLKRWSQTLRTAFDAYAGDDDFGTSSSPFWATFQTELIDKEIRATMRRVRRVLSPDLMLEAYVNLFQLQAYRMSKNIDQKLIISALDLARIVNSQESYGRLNRALAYAYARQGEFEKALDKARLAYAYWSNTRNKVEIATVAYAMALSYRIKRELDVAEHWLMIASENFSQTKYPRQYAVIAGEMGNILMMREEYTASYEWLTIANQEAQLIDPHTRAVIQHCYGIVQTDLGYYEDATDSLNLSLRYWQDTNDQYQIAHLTYAFAFLAYNQGDYDTAIKHLDESEAIYNTVQDNPFNGLVKDLITALREKIANK